MQINCIKYHMACTRAMSKYKTLTCLNLHGTYYCVWNGQVFSLCKLNKQRFPSLRLYLKLNLYRILFYSRFGLDMFHWINFRGQSWPWSSESCIYIYLQSVPITTKVECSDYYLLWGVPQINEHKNKFSFALPYFLWYFYYRSSNLRSSHYTDCFML